MILTIFIVMEEALKKAFESLVLPKYPQIVGHSITDNMGSLLIGLAVRSDVNPELKDNIERDIQEISKQVLPDVRVNVLINWTDYPDEKFEKLIKRLIMPLHPEIKKVKLTRGGFGRKLIVSYDLEKKVIPDEVYEKIENDTEQLFNSISFGKDFLRVSFHLV